MLPEVQRARVYTALLALILAGGTVLRVVHLHSHRFHVDEALFAAYGLSIASGTDPLLQQEAVDKPPAFFYLLALAFKVFGRSEAAAAVPSMVASVGSIALVYYLCRRFFDVPTALAAALLMAISPFNVAYAYTAFIDPTLVAVALLAAALAERRLFFAAGILAGLLPALKAQGVLILPLVVLLGLFALVQARERRGRWLKAGALFAAGAALPLAATWYWSSLRTEQRTFLDLAAEHNPLLVSDPATYSVRLTDWWLSSLQYLTGSPLLNYVVLVGVPLLLLWDLVVLATRREPRRFAALDWALAGFLAFFVGWHTYFDHPAWDRYMLGTAPVGLILIARAFALPWRLWQALGRRWVPEARAAWSLATAVALMLSVSAPTPVLAGLRSTYPIAWAGEVGPAAYIGIEDVAAYLRANAEPEAVLFDYQTLSWHYKYYLFGEPFEVVWFDDTLVWSFRQQVLTRPEGQPKYIVMPDWVNDEKTRSTLAGDAVRFEDVYRTYRPDGSVSFTIYRLAPIRR